MKVKVISLPYIFQVLYVLCFTRPRYQVSVCRTIGPLVFSIEKVKIDNFFTSPSGYLEFIFTQMYIEESSMFHMSFVQIAEFDWLPGRQKG